MIRAEANLALLPGFLVGYGVAVSASALILDSVMLFPCLSLMYRSHLLALYRTLISFTVDTGNSLSAASHGRPLKVRMTPFSFLHSSSHLRLS